MVTSKGGNDTAEEYVDLIELNHFYDNQGRHVYDQVIFYEKTPDTGRFQVRAWCLVEDRDFRNRRPIKNMETKLYQVDWFDNDQRLHRIITSRLFRESWTQVDPERANKKIVEERSRIALVQNPKKFQLPRVRCTEDSKQPSSHELNIATDDSAKNLPQVAQASGIVSVPVTEVLVVR